MDTPSPIPGLTRIVARQRAAFAQHEPDYRQRIDDLRRLRAAFRRDLPAFADAMSADFGHRSRHESLLTDGMTVLGEIDHTLANLRRWMRPVRVRVDGVFLPASAEIRYRPLGVVGVIAPWNYPVNLALVPMVGALAAGNHVMLKPSELTPRTGALLERMLGDVFPPERVACVSGGPDVGAAFAALPFDHLVFTGSTAIGRKVMQSAAGNLTPVTLELGGKSPAILAPGFPVALAAWRIAAGKMLNAGQTCVAPDYVLLTAAAREPFIAAFRDYIARHYPQLRDTPDFSSIVNDAHYARLTALVDEARAGGARIMTVPDDGAHDPARRVFAPTLVCDAPPESRLLKEEIFGPILPLVTVADVDAAVAYANARPRPLALYLFDRDSRRVQAVLDSVHAGGVTVNDCLLHFAQSRLPIGGIGPSGMGQYHGHAGFETFSKAMPVVHQVRHSPLALLRPPYLRRAERLLRFLTR